MVTRDIIIKNSYESISQGFSAEHNTTKRTSKGTRVLIVAPDSDLVFGCSMYVGVFNFVKCVTTCDSQQQEPGLDAQWKKKKKNKKTMTNASRITLYYNTYRTYYKQKVCYETEITSRASTAMCCNISYVRCSIKVLKKNILRSL